MRFNQIPVDEPALIGKLKEAVASSPDVNLGESRPTRVRNTGTSCTSSISPKSRASPSLPSTSSARSSSMAVARSTLLYATSIAVHFGVALSLGRMKNEKPHEAIAIALAETQEEEPPKAEALPPPPPPPEGSARPPAEGEDHPEPEQEAKPAATPVEQNRAARSMHCRISVLLWVVAVTLVDCHSGQEYGWRRRAHRDRGAGEGREKGPGACCGSSDRKRLRRAAGEASRSQCSAALVHVTSKSRQHRGKGSGRDHCRRARSGNESPALARARIWPG